MTCLRRVLLLSIAVVAQCIGQEHYYYVTPSLDVPCPGDPCLTISQYAQVAEQYFTSDATFQFLSGDHILPMDIIIQGVSRLSLIGSEDSATKFPLAISTRILCGRVLLDNITQLTIGALSFSLCNRLNNTYAASVFISNVEQLEFMNCSFSDSLNPAVFLSDVKRFELSGCLFQNISESALLVVHSSGIIESSSFIGNQASNTDSGGGIHAIECEITMIDNQFLNNTAVSLGGAIAVGNCVLEFIGSNIFYDNTVKNVDSVSVYEGVCGGGISAEFSKVTFSGDNVFTRNLAQGSTTAFGGAICLRGCTANFSGSNSFTNNFAASNVSLQLPIIGTIVLAMGGGVFVRNSSVNFTGKTYFANNLQGAILIQASIVNFTGYTAIQNNTGAIWPAGGVEADNSTVNFFGNTSFASNLHGGIQALWSIITFQGNTNFEDNFALVGGGVHIAGTMLSFSGNTSLKNNSALVTGGAISAGEDDPLQLFTGSFLNEFQEKSTIIKNDGKLIFEDNRALGLGGGIHLLEYNMISVGSVTFFHNIAASGGALSTQQNANVTFSGENSFINNAADAGGAINIFSTTISFRGTTVITGNLARTGSGVSASFRSDLTFDGNTTFSHNLADVLGGGGVTVSISNLKLYGNSTFTNNTAPFSEGGAIEATNSIISMSGNCKLTENSAIEGGALSLGFQSQLYLLSPLVLQFESNKAERGAAINIDDLPMSINCLKYTYSRFILKDILETPCFFVPDAGFPNVQLIFVNNSATDSGSALYGGFLNTCKPRPLKGYGLLAHAFPQNDATILFNQLSQLSDTSPITESELVSSEPIQTCICVNNTSSCSSNNISASVVRGEKFTISVIALDQVDKAVPASIRAELPSDGGTNAAFGEFESIQQIGGNCSDLFYSLFSPDEFEDFILYAEGPCGNSGNVHHTVQVHFLPCPDGFELSLSRCICEKRIQKFTNTCLINDRTIGRQGDFWFGAQYENETYRGLILHPHCPFDYCISEGTTIPFSNPNKQCAFNRSALLCGSCQQNLSLALGSSKCCKCSNVYLALLIPFAIAGIVLVSILILLKLTVAAGTINGLIFYANIVAVNHSIFFPPGTTNILTVFIAWLNLDLGIEICFFDGMDTYARVWLQFVFPVYIWVMVGGIITASYYSTRVTKLLGRNPVSVLATVFLLSYTKLLRTIIAALYFDSQLEYPDGSRVTVWLYDGNIRYLRGKHIPLFLFAVLALLVLFLPYALVLLLGQWIQANSNKKYFHWIVDYRVKAILDAYHGPYNDNHRFWTGFLLLLRCALLLVNALGDPSINLLAIASATLGLAILTRHIGSIYKTCCLNLLESSFILNLGLLAAATYHITLAGGSQEAVTYTSVGVAFTEFVGILIYHIYLQVRVINCRKWYSIFSKKEPSETQDTVVEEVPIEQPTVTTSYINIRELLLESDQ